MVNNIVYSSKRGKKKNPLKKGKKRPSVSARLDKTITYDTVLGSMSITCLVLFDFTIYELKCLSRYGSVI